MRLLRSEVMLPRAEMGEIILSLNIWIIVGTGDAAMRWAIRGHRPVDHLSLSVMGLTGKGLSVDAV